MAVKYWYSATNANWATTNWYTSAPTAGGPVGSPTTFSSTIDDAVFTQYSGTALVTIAASVTAKSVVMTGFTGTLALNATLSINGSDNGTSSGNSLVLGSSTTYTGTNAVTFISTVGGKITCNGSTLSSGIIINGAGSVYTTTDILRIIGTLVLTAGSFSTIYDCYLGSISSSNSNIRSLSFGFGLITPINLYLTGTGTLTTFTTTTNLSMFAGFNCYVTDSSASAKTLTYNTVFQNSNNVYLGGSGSGSITFAAGTTGAPFVYVTNTGGAAISFSTGTISALVWQAGTNAVWSNAASQTLTIGFDLVLTSSMGDPTLTPSIIMSYNTVSGSSLNGIYCTFVTANKTFVTGTITFNDAVGAFNMQVTGDINCNSNITITAAPSGVYIFGNINQSLVTNTLTLTAGVLGIQNGGNVTCGSFSSSNSNTRTLNMGSGLWTLTGTGNVWLLTTSTGMTLNAGQSRILINNTANPTVGATFAGGGLTYYTVEYARGTSIATNSISGNNTYVNFIFNSSAAVTISWASGSTQTFYNFVVNGASGALVTMGRSSTASVTFVKVGQGIVSKCNYVSANSTTTATPANTWYLGANGSGGGGGWILSNAPSSQSLLGAGGAG